MDVTKENEIDIPGEGKGNTCQNFSAYHLTWQSSLLTASIHFIGSFIMMALWKAWTTEKINMFN